MAVLGARYDRNFTYLSGGDTGNGKPPPLKDRLVIVPFGARQALGVVVAEDVPHPRRVALKPIARVAHPAPFLDPVRRDLATALSRRFLWTLSETLQLFLPPDAALDVAYSLRRGAAAVKMSPLETRVYNALPPDSAAPLATVQKALRRKLRPAYLRQMRRRGLIEIEEDASFSSEFTFQAMEWNPPPGEFSLHHAEGWTAEDWERAAERVGAGGQVLVLAPEKGFFDEISRRARSPVHFYHSDLSPKHQTAVWNRVLSGEPGIYAGTRSIVFAPFARPAEVWVLWEEDDRYEHQRHPRYNARWIAECLARLWRIPFYGFTEAPSVDFYHRVEACFDAAPRPPLTVVNLREKRISYLLTRALHAVLESAVRDRTKMIFLMGRLGYSYVVCKSCGAPVTCPECGHILVYSKRTNALSCQPCVAEYPAIELCPECGSPTMKERGGGTERLEAELLRIFKGMPVFRFDSRSAPDEAARRMILDQFDAAPGAAALVASPLILGEPVKSPALRIVVVGEHFWSFPDYRAAEFAFARLRHFFSAPGPGYIQTFSPHFYLLQSLEGNDPPMFYRQELKMREQLGYPPYGSLLKITFTGKDGRVVEREGRRMKQWMQTHAPGDAIFLGPVVTEASPAPSGGEPPAGRAPSPDSATAQLLVKVPRLSGVDDWRAAGWLDRLRESRVQATAQLDTPEFRDAPGAPARRGT